MDKPLFIVSICINIYGKIYLNEGLSPFYKLMKCDTVKVGKAIIVSFEQNAPKKPLCDLGGQYLLIPICPNIKGKYGIISAVQNSS